MISSKRPGQRGQSMVEYVALTALVAIVCIGTVKVFGGKVRSRLNQITNTFDRNIQAGLKAKPDLGGDDEDEGGFPFPGGIRFPRGIKLPGGIKFPGGFPGGIFD